MRNTHKKKSLCQQPNVIHMWHKNHKPWYAAEKFSRRRWKLEASAYSHSAPTASGRPPLFGDKVCSWVGIPIHFIGVGWRLFMDLWVNIYLKFYMRWFKLTLENNHRLCPHISDHMCKTSNRQRKNYMQSHDHNHMTTIPQFMLYSVQHVHVKNAVYD